MTQAIEKRGKAYPEEVRAQALALYEEHRDSYTAARLLEDELGDAPDPRTIQRWAKQVDGLAARLSHERKQALAERWYHVAEQLLDRVEDRMDDLKPDQIFVPAAIATDKYHKLVTEDAPLPAQSGPFVVFIKT